MIDVKRRGRSQWLYRFPFWEWQTIGDKERRQVAVLLCQVAVLLTHNKTHSNSGCPNLVVPTILLSAWRDSLCSRDTAVVVMTPVIDAWLWSPRCLPSTHRFKITTVWDQREGLELAAAFFLAVMTFMLCWSHSVICSSNTGIYWWHKYEKFSCGKNKTFGLKACIFTFETSKHFSVYSVWRFRSLIFHTLFIPFNNCNIDVVKCRGSGKCHVWRKTEEDG